jgi:hypothetical protein
MAIKIRDTFDKYAPEVCEERRRRILVSIWACSYEMFSYSFVDDFTFDAESYKINKDARTGHKVMDEFFKTEFDPCTGSWVQSHPEKEKLIVRTLEYMESINAISDIVTDLKKLLGKAYSPKAAAKYLVGVK